MESKGQYSESLNRLIDRLAKLPGIGRRTAERLAFFMLKSTSEDALALADAIRDVKENVRNCSECFNLTESDPCAICSSDHRDRDKILVVEQPRDVIGLEETRSYRGQYHVLLGHLSPLEGVEPSDLTMGALVERVTARAAELGRVEVILGTNPNMEGDGTALFLADRLAKVEGVQISRLARGLPAGTQLEYANKAVLSDAIVSRQKLQ